MHVLKHIDTLLEGYMWVRGIAISSLYLKVLELKNAALVHYVNHGKSVLEGKKSKSKSVNHNYVNQNSDRFTLKKIPK